MPETSHIEIRKKIVRKNHRRFHKDGKGFVLLTPPEVFIMMRFLRRIAWDCFIIDEPFQMIHQKSEVGASYAEGKANTRKNSRDNHLFKFLGEDSARLERAIVAGG